MSDRSVSRAAPLWAGQLPRMPGDLLIVAVLVGLATAGGMEFAQRAGRIPTIWPANGLLLAILLSCRSTKWPSLILVGFLANLAGAFTSNFPVLTCLRLSLVNSFEVVLAIALLRSLVGRSFDISHPRTLWRFALSAGLLAPALAVCLNMGLLFLSADPRSSATYAASFLAHALGMVTVTPVALAIRRREFAPLLAPGRIRQTVLAFTALLGTTALVFMQSRYPFLFMICPPLVMVVFRCGLAGGALGLFLSTLVSIGFTITGAGPTHIMVDASDVERIIVVQLFAATAGCLVLTLSAMLAESDRAHKELEAAKIELTKFAITDSLTGLNNRRRLDQMLDEECRRAARNGAPLSFLLIDVDRFKALNDHYGHLEGDACLRAIAAKVMGFGRRTGDLAARYGGEEIAMLLPATDEAGASMLAETVRAAIADLKWTHVGNEACGGVVTVSIGIATAAPGRLPYHPEALVKAADDLLYEAKRTGRNKVLSVSRRPVDPLPPPIADEDKRWRAVDAYRAAMGEGRLCELDDIARRAADLLDSPVGLISLIGRDEQVFIGRHGVEIANADRKISICAHTITSSEPMVVLDATADARFEHNPFVTGEFSLRFYAGVPLIEETGAQAIGALCVVDRVAHKPLSPAKRTELVRLASLATQTLASLNVLETAVG